MELVWSFWTSNGQSSRVYVCEGGRLSANSVGGGGRLGTWRAGAGGRGGGRSFRLPGSHTGLGRENCWLWETLRDTGTVPAMRGWLQEGRGKVIAGLRLQGRRPMVFCACGWGGNPLQTPHRSWKWQEAFFSCNVPPESSTESLKSCSLERRTV